MAWLVAVVGFRPMNLAQQRCDVPRAHVLSQMPIRSCSGAAKHDQIAIFTEFAMNASNNVWPPTKIRGQHSLSGVIFLVLSALNP